MTPTPELRHCFYCGEAIGLVWPLQIEIETCSKPECQRAFHDEIRAANVGHEKGKS